MINIRWNIFETNSSMSHSITLFKKEKYDKWIKNKNLYYLISKEKFIKNPEAKKMRNKAWEEKLTKSCSNLKEYDNIHDALVDGNLGCIVETIPLTYEEFMNYQDFEMFYTEHKINGMKLIAICFAGRD